ncbi:MAG: response regulator [Magnetococcales bacterium]|nr:response regulator [Magnetococcales bacterium]
MNKTVATQPLILVVDDEEIIFKSVRNALNSREYQFMHAPDGRIAFRMLQEHNPILIILDIRMPNMGGVEFLQQLQLTSNDPFSVIVLTGHAESKEIAECFNLGINAFLRKPFNIYELQGMVRQTIKLKQSANELVRTNQYMHDMIDRSMDIIFSVDANQNIVEFNPAAEKAFGYAANEIKGKPVAGLFHKENGNFSLSYMDGTKRYSGKVLFRRKNRESFSASLAVAPWHTLEGSLEGSIANARDLTTDLVEEVSAPVKISPFLIGRRAIRFFGSAQA